MYRRQAHCIHIVWCAMWRESTQVAIGTYMHMWCKPHHALHGPLNIVAYVEDLEMIDHSPFFSHSMARSGDEDGENCIYQLVKDLVQFSRSRTYLPVGNVMECKVTEYGVHLVSCGSDGSVLGD